MGIEYINSPVDLIPCLAEDVKRALKEIKKLIEQGKTPIYIHCFEGVDRTGFVIAAYRVIEEGWDINKAIEKWKEEKTEEGKIIRSKAPLIWEGCFRKNFKE
jgi:protein tyrosine/serine phosphatase